MPDFESEESAEQKRNQKGQGLKTLTADQMLSRLSISLAQIKTEIIQKSLKTKKRNYYVLCIVQRKYPKQSAIIWSMLFKKWKQFLWTLKIVK